jgi:hypothetical protein
VRRLLEVFRKSAPLIKRLQVLKHLVNFFLGQPQLEIGVKRVADIMQNRKTAVRRLATFQAILPLERKTSGEHQDDQNQQNQTQSAARSITPVSTMIPRGHGAQQHQN